MESERKGRLGLSMKSQWKLLNESEFEMKTENHKDSERKMTDERHDSWGNNWNIEWRIFIYKLNELQCLLWRAKSLAMLSGSQAILQR